MKYVTNKKRVTTNQQNFIGRHYFIFYFSLPFSYPVPVIPVNLCSLQKRIG